MRSCKDSNFKKSYRKLLNYVRDRVIRSENIDLALSYAWIYGELRWLNHDGIYQDEDIENIIEDKVFQSKQFKALNYSNESEGGNIIIASEMYGSGGHSRVIKAWLDIFSENQNHKLIITRSIESSVKNILSNQRFSYYICRNKNNIFLINEILEKTKNAKQIILFIHPSDIVSAIAARVLAKNGKNIIFYNHADHAFSYAITSADIVCEISDYGAEINKKLRKIKKSCYLGIPLKYQEINGINPSQSNELKIILTCGDPYKYQSKTLFFGQLIDTILKLRCDTVFKLVGPSGDESEWNGYKKKWRDRIDFLGVIRHDQYINLMKMADLYIDSFPLPGGTAFPEALINGKNIAGLNTVFFGYSPADKLRFQTIDQLVEFVNNILNNDADAINKINNIRKQVIEYHSFELFKLRVEKLYTGILNQQEISDKFIDLNWIETEWEKKEKIILPSWRCIYAIPKRDALILLFRSNLKYLDCLYVFKYLLRLFIFKKKY